MNAFGFGSTAITSLNIGSLCKSCKYIYLKCIPYKVASFPNAVSSTILELTSSSGLYLISKLLLYLLGRCDILTIDVLFKGKISNSKSLYVS